MAQSPEYPDLRWVPPKAWTDANRTAVQLIVMHTTEGSAHDQSAEDGAAYNQRRDDGTSAHYFVDSDSVIHCVRTADQAHTARRQGNRRGIHYELCGRAGWSATTWAGPYAQVMLRLAAKQAARDAKKWGIPVRHLTVSQVADGEKGFCGHWDITRAFPQDNGTHTDPGQAFPWSQFLDLVRAELEDDMPITDADLDKIEARLRPLIDAVPKKTLDLDVVPNYGDDAETNPTTSVKWGIGRGAIASVVAYQVRARVDALADVVRAIAVNVAADDADLPAILARIDEARAGTVADIRELLGGDGQSAEQVAAALRAALGDRAAEVGRLLAAA